ncbi:MAG TPA: hypothetical protein PLY00_18040 [Verrucomicrobiota bacterium]|nr:hypothetical protein [Verrucomicrobiota bacterium]OQC64149.1 MAG: hypothetical protein BWX48_02884 [Verrucomicrobia bacterium ADurb.Bin006]HOI37756.1 hypothetical protein [Bacillota bacterium]HOR73160.1 hypothetical protein [Verrucomicrobiota bacterium]HPW82627.1 hypothetical protein [Verrucomicrobiota bacterium]
MTRRSFGHSDSLDMLLDTMCNTFGGVILIALLISLLARDIPNTTTDASSAATTRDLWLRYTNALAKHSEVQSEFDSAAPALSLLDKVEVLRQQVLDARSATSGLRREAGECERRIREAKEVQRKLASELSDLNHHIQQLTQELIGVTNHKAGEIRAPRSVPALASHYWDYVVKDGKLWPVMILVNGQPDWNRVYIDVQGGGSSKRLHPIPERGIDIRHGTDAFQRTLAVVSPADYVVRFWLYADSFLHLAPLRRIVVDRGFGYDLVLCEPHTTLRTSPGGSGRARQLN